ncbi:MAG: hypothetical protein D6722_06865 [Bacteroidetes bacterium]|nr:MAG: hypothetical protein D6722_06865 [Bacteroidota bacterium]
MKRFFLVTLVCLGALTTVLAQRNRPNFSIQLGYGTRFFNPAPLNLAIDSVYNVQAAALGLDQGLSEVKWTPGFFGAVALHRGRASFRASYSTFGASSFALGIDSVGLDYRRDLAVRGQLVTVSLTSELIPIGDYVTFCVGTGFNAMRLQTATAQVAASAFDPEAELQIVSDEWKPGFLVQAPFRVHIPPIFAISLEPYYQVFFSPGDFTGVSRAISGPSSLDGRLKGDIDHFGINAALIVYLRPR